MNKKRTLFFVLLVALNIAVIVYLISGNISKEKVQGRNIHSANYLEGKNLAAMYCQSCHMLPNPGLLPKEMWVTGVMPTMGPFFGFKSFKGQPYHEIKDVDPKRFPPKPAIDSVKWQKIFDYYVHEAPEKMPGQSKEIFAIEDVPFFNVILPKQTSFFGKASLSTFVKIDTTVVPHRIFVDNTMTNELFMLDGNLDIKGTAKTHGPLVNMTFQHGLIMTCVIGKSLEGNNLSDGSITPLKITSNQLNFNAHPLFDKLARPVQAVGCDLNNDGVTDYLITQFGNVVGDLSWREGKKAGGFITHILRNKPGAISAIVQDINHDGKPDVWALFAQGDEGVFLYTNDGKGEMEEKQVLRFPPSYGSTSFEIVDFNKDGYPDIIYTCGDNADYTPVLKPYHGVYIFLNDGKNNFKQRYFYPINGCYKAIARDFDNDGLLDIAAVSFFPARRQPREAFTLLKNLGAYKFKSYSLPLKTPFQKGITMDAGDIDGDGKLDIILGSGYYSSDAADKHTEPLFIILKNKSKN